MNYTIDAKENVIPLMNLDLGQVRALWKECFHDTEAYMDFYFSWKTRDNVIYGLYDEDKLISMVHLNPYQLSVNGDKIDSYYIVGVATDALYRKRGLMRKLLIAAMQQMYNQKVPFTYLMPAKEEIYLPFDFRIVTTQKNMSIPLYEISRSDEEPQLTAASIRTHVDPVGIKLQLKESGNEEHASAEDSKTQMITTQTVNQKVTRYQKFPQFEAFLVEAREVEQLKDLAQFANHMLAQENEIYTVRDSVYYERMLAELQVLQGGILAVKEGKQLLGYSAFAIEDGKLEVLEFLCKDEVRDKLLQTMYAEVLERIQNLDIAVSSQAMPSQAPPIMARIIHAKKFFEGLRATQETTFTINLTDPLISENNGVYTIRCDQKQCAVTKLETKAYHELDMDLVCEVADLTRLFFGQMSHQELHRLIPGQKGKTEQKLKNLNLYDNVHINEIV